MTIAFEQFTPIASLIGGMMIGLAAFILMATNGRVMGISGILGGLVTQSAPKSDKSWQLTFLAGAVVGPLVMVFTTGDAVPATYVTEGFWLMAAGDCRHRHGHGSGCTSGHGICGLAYLSPRPSSQC